MYQHNYKNSKVVGDIGEKRFYEAYPDLLNRLDGRDSDAEMKENGDGIELKTDTYRMQYTPNTKSSPNMFIERYSNSNYRNPGGPWQAIEKGSKYFVYYYIHDGVLFWCDNIPRLVAYLDATKDEADLKPVYNKGKGGQPDYYTLGWPITRKELKPFFKRFNLGDPLPT